MPTTPVQITPLAKVSAGFSGTIPPLGTVHLYKNSGWGGPFLSISTSNNDYQPNRWHSLAGMPMQDNATWIAFCLPVGIVMTLTDNSVPLEPITQSPSSSSQAPPPLVGLKNAGRVVDLVGTGRIETVDLAKVNMNDCISAFLWRQVDLSMGAIELYEDENFAGNRTVLFLAEWPPDTVVSLQGWYISGKMSSAKWETLRDVQLMTLTSAPDGSGKQYGNISGSGSSKTMAKFGEVSFNDCVASFSWSSVVPMMEVIKPINVEFPAATLQGTSQSNSETLTNPSTSTGPIEGEVRLDWSIQNSLTVTSSDSYHVGSSVTVTTTLQTSALVVTATLAVAVSVSFDYTHTAETSTTTGQSITKTDRFTFPVPPGKTVTGTLTAMQGTMKAETFQATARRWYKNQLAGTTQDPKNNNWWMRDEPLTLTMQGSQTLGVTAKISSN